MKKLLLLPLIAIGLALVPAKQADAQVSVGVGGVGSDSVIPHIGTATTDIRDIMVITRVAIMAISGVLRTTERITTLGGRTTTAAIELTSIASILTIATKADGLV